MPRELPRRAPVPPALRELIKQFLEKLIEQHGREAVETAVTETLARTVGRPRIDDRTALEYMHKLLISGKAKNPTDAAQQAMDLGLTDIYIAESTKRRLRDKYRKQRAEIAARAAMGQAVEGFYDLYGALIEARRAFLEPGEKLTRAASEFAARGETMERAFRESMAGLFPHAEKK